VRYIGDENGQGTVEYGLILCFISVAAVVAIALLGPTVKGLFDNANTEIAK